MPKQKNSHTKALALVFLLILYAGVVGIGIYLIDQNPQWEHGKEIGTIKLIFYTIWWIYLITAVLRAITIQQFVRGSAYMFSALMITNSIYGIVYNLDFVFLWYISGLIFGALLVFLIMDDMKKMM